MEIRLLGPVRLDHAGTALGLAGPKQRAVLAMLALDANATVSVDRLIEGLWGERLPATAPKMVQLYVSQLRKLLEADGGVEIATHGRGYSLVIEPESVDVVRFERLVAEASGRNGRSPEAARAALTLWGGQPLADVLDEPFAPPEARRLEELHLTALELALESDLGAGRHREAIGSLEAAVAGYPLSERLHGLRMLALYRAGRQSQALEAYRDARKTLVEQMGVEPGPQLRRLHEAILRHDPGLELQLPDTEWVRRETVQRMDAEAQRAARQRGELREVEAELASSVTDLQQLRADADAPVEGVTVCPFKGLASFDVADADYFFGRERLVAEIVARVVGSTLVGIVGPSGSGKSSTLRAGLLPALADGSLPGSERWRRTLIRPGEHPLGELRDALDEGLRDLEPDTRLVLSIDQFEEVFTVCRDPAERAEFMEAIADAAEPRDGRVVVVLALRADYYGACAAFPRLSRLLGETNVLVGPMRADELTRAIEAPAARAGLVVEPGLATKLVGDVAGRPGALPLLSTALLELWQHGDGRRMTVAAYDGSGGVSGAVARLAETVYGRLSTEERATARRILLRLTGPGEGDSVVRRRVPLAELEPERDPQAAAVLDALSDGRMVTVDELSAEVAHEALLREWPRLRGWLEEDADGRRLHRHLTLAAGEWQGRGRDPGELYRGARLAATLDWAAEHGEEPNRLEREFLETSRLADEREAERGRRVNRRLRALLAAGAVALAIAVAAGVLALEQRGDARDAARAADAQRLGVEALTQDRLDQALLLASAAADLDDSAATRSNLLSVLLRSPAALGIVHGSGAGFLSLALSPDGRTVAAGADDGELILFDAATRARIARQRVQGAVTGLAFDPSGDALAVASARPPDRVKGDLEILDARTLRPRNSIALGHHPAGPGLFSLPSATYTDGGRVLVVAYTGGVLNPGTPAFLRRFDAGSGSPLGPPARIAAQSSLVAPIQAPSGRLIYSSPDATYLVDAGTLRVVRTYPVGARSAKIGPGGHTLALESADRRLQELDLDSGKVRTVAGRQAAGLAIGAFSPDGRHLATSDDDGKVVIWDLDKAAVTETLAGHSDGLVPGNAAAFSTDGRTLFTAGLDSSVIEWDVSGVRRLGRPFTAGIPFGESSESLPPGFSISPDGRTLAVARPDGRVDLIDARTLRRRGDFEAFGGSAALTVEYSPDGSQLAVGSADGAVGVWGATTGRRVGALLRERQGAEAPAIHALAFGPNGLLATADASGVVRTWDANRREVTGWTLRLPPSVLSLAFRPDGAELAIAVGRLSSRGDSGVEVREARSGKRVARLATDGTRAVAFSPDGDLLAGGEDNGRTLIWHTDDWQRAGQALSLRQAPVLALDFSPDGHTLATSQDDGRVVLWDVDSHEAIGSPLVGQPDYLVRGRFTPNGERLFTVYDNARALRWEIDPDRWERQACLVAGRGLTRREWERWLPEQPFRSVC